MGFDKMIYTIVFAGLFAVVSVASVVAQTTVVVNPAAKNVLPGETFTLNVVVNNVTNLHGAHVVFTFDNAIIRSTLVADGGFLASNGDPVFFQRNPAPGPTVGSITVDQAMLAPGGITGSGTLFSVTFSAVGNGISSVTLSSLDLRDAFNVSIPATIQNGSVMVSNPTIVVNPSTKNVLPTGGNFTLSINIANAVNVHAFHVVFSLNNAVIRYAGRVEGSFLNGGGVYSTFFTSNPTPAPSVTSVTVDNAILGPDAANGDGTLFTITFAPVANGTSSVTLSAIDLRDLNNNTIPAIMQSGGVTVNNPVQVYVDPAYNAGNQGGHEFGYDAHNSLSAGLTAVSSGGTMNIAPASYNVTFNLTKNVTLTPMSGTPVIQNLTLNTLAVSLGGNVQVSNTLTLTSGILTTGSHNINVTNNTAAAVVVGSGSINGAIQRAIAAGSVGSYTFTDLNTQLIPNGSQGAMTALIRSYPNTFPPNIGGGSSIKRYYTVTPSGALTASLRLAYVDAEINGIPEFTMSLFRYSGAAWVPATSIPNPGSNYVEAPLVSQFSDWTIGDADFPLPIQLASFTGTVLGTGNVALTWVTLSELNNYGFYVQRKLAHDQDYIEIQNSFVAGHGTTNEPHTYVFTDVAPGTGSWMYRLRQIDLNGTEYFTEPIQVDVVTGVEEPGSPTAYALKQNYPNPFNPTTMIEFNLPSSGYISLKIYNLLGEEVASLIDGLVEAGRHAIPWNASGLPSSVYLYKLTADNFVETKRLVLMK